MAAVWLRLGAELRSRWRAWLGLAVLVGFGGGIVLGALAGARRTDSAYDEFLVSQRAYDVLVVSGRPPIFPSASFDLDEIAALPVVAESARFSVLGFFGMTERGQAIEFDTNVPLVTTDGRFGTEMNRLHMVEGRAPRRPNEVAPSFAVADNLDLHVGDHIDGSFLTQDQLDDLFESNQPPDNAQAEHLRLRVVGIEASPGEFPPLSEAGSNSGFLHFAPSFIDSAYFAGAVDSIAVRLKNGEADVPAFKRALERRSGGRSIFLRSQQETSTATQRAIGVQADALRLVALLGAVAAALLIGQALGRHARLDAADRPVLRSLGMSGGQLFAAATVRVAAIGLVGAVLAVALATAVSPLTPVGVARNAEVDLGIEIDPLVLGVGFVAVIVVVLLTAVPAIVGISGAARRGEGAVATRQPTRPPRVVEALTTLGLPSTALNGVRLAVESGRGSVAASARSTVLGVTVAVAVLAGVVGFSASLERLLDEPRLYGWNWDAQLGDPFSPDIGERVATELGERREVGAAAYGSILQMTIGGRRVDVLGVTSVKGGLGPALTEGRAPRGDDELVLGSKTLATLGASVGDRVRVEFGSESTRLRIVGRVVLPDLGETGGLGHGAAMPMRAVRRLAPETPANVVLVRASSDDRAPELVADLSEVTSGGVVELGGPYLPTRPVDLENIQRADSMPFVIGVGTGVVAIATIVHGLVSSVRRRRRELAVLKTLGFGRRQISQVVRWQATTVAVIALVIGIPLGLVAGRIAWSLFADQLGVIAEHEVSLVVLALLVPVVVLVANIAAAFPGRMAARTSPAIILRSE